MIVHWFWMMPGRSLNSLTISHLMLVNLVEGSLRSRVILCMNRGNVVVVSVRIPKGHGPYMFFFLSIYDATHFRVVNCQVSCFVVLVQQLLYCFSSLLLP